MRDMVWALAAEADLYEIAEKYGRIAPRLDDDLLSRIADAPLILLEYPMMGEAVGILGLRKWAVRHTPFILLYRVKDEAVEVARVIPAAGDWRED